MKILFLSPQLPFPANTGGTIKSYKLIEYLAKNHELTLCTLLKNDDLNHKKQFQEKVELVDYSSLSINVPRNIVNFMLSIIHLTPLNIFRNYNKIFLSIVKNKSKGQDVIFIDHYLMYQYVPEGFSGKVVLHQHNTEFIMWKRFAEIEPNLIRKTILYFEALRIKKYEKKICNSSNQILAAPNDIELLTSLGIDKRKFALTYHLGNEDYSNMPNLKFDSSQNAIMYVGTLSWEANIDGLEWFLNKGWSILKKQIPDLKIYIIGKNPDTRIIEAAKNKEGIIFTGFVDDLEEYFNKCKVFIAPLRFGSGMKVKVISAMSRGIPTVTTTVGAEGIDVKHMHHLAVCDDVQLFTDSIVSLIKNKEQWEILSVNSKQLIQKQYTWNNVFKNVELAIS